HFVGVRLEGLCIYRRRSLLGTVVAMQPDRDILRVRDLIENELFAGNLRYIDRDLRVSGRGPQERGSGHVERKPVLGHRSSPSRDWCRSILRWPLSETEPMLNSYRRASSESCRCLRACRPANRRFARAAYIPLNENACATTDRSLSARR